MQTEQRLKDARQVYNHVDFLRDKLSKQNTESHDIAEQEYKVYAQCGDPDCYFEECAGNVSASEQEETCA